jgi:hypothetical protein
VGGKEKASTKTICSQHLHSHSLLINSHTGGGREEEGIVNTSPALEMQFKQFYFYPKMFLFGSQQATGLVITGLTLQ